MNGPHYTPALRPAGTWYFTSPLGTHEDCMNRELCEEMAEKIDAEHRRRSEGAGAEAGILADYFGREEFPDHAYDSWKDQEIIAECEATKR